MKELLGNFELVATAPGGIEFLRKLVLELAVRGKLVPQDRRDESASELLKRIAAEKARLVKEGKIRAPKELTPITEEEKPFELPRGWEWVRFGVIGTCRLGKMLDEAKNSGKKVRYLRNTNVQWGRFDLADIKELRLEKKELGEYQVSNNDLLICEGGEPGRCAIWESEKGGYVAFQKALHRFRSDGAILPKYLFNYMRYFSENGLQVYFTGATIKHLTGQSLEQVLVPLPPLPEQQRIVARVQELMAVLDRLESKSAEAEALRAKALASTSSSLAGASSLSERRASWARMDKSFDALARRPEDVKALRSTILELAVRGALVSQDKNDESASELLKRIAAEKTRLVKEGKIRAPKELALIREEEKPFQLPRGWVWVRLGEIGNIISGGTPDINKVEYWSNARIPWVCPKDMKHEIINSTIDKISQKAVTECNLNIVDENTILIVVRGMILAKKVPIAISGAPLAINQDMKAIVPYRLEIVPYAPLFLAGRNDALKSLVEHSTHGTCKLETSKLLDFVLAIPPLAEQERIVARVDELVKACDRLEAGLRAEEEGARKFAQAASAF